MDHIPLKLHAVDEEDLHIISSYLQDALFPLSSMHVDYDQGTFSCLLNRFCWEHEEDHKTHGFYYRIHTGVLIKNIQAVHTRNFDHQSPHRVMNLLALKTQASDNGGVFLSFLFAHDKEIRLEVSALNLWMNDVESPWPTKKKPIHIHEHLEAAYSLL